MILTAKWVSGLLQSRTKELKAQRHKGVEENGRDAMDCGRGATGVPPVEVKGTKAQRE